jgi:hypothetical protein
MSPQWKFRYSEIDRLEKLGVIKVIEEERIPWEGDPKFAVRSLFVRTCPNCKSEHTYSNAEYIFTQLNKPFCKLCYRENPDHPRFKYKQLPRATDMPLDFLVDKKNGVADVYARVSTRAQSFGNGLARQEEYGIEYCQLNRIKVRHIIHDICSAYSKDNCETGNLGSKMREWEYGKELPPQFLVIEDMDRFSRQHPWKAMGHVQRIKNLDITLVITGTCGHDWRQL